MSYTLFNIKGSKPVSNDRLHFFSTKAITHSFPMINDTAITNATRGTFLLALATQHFFLILQGL